MRGVLAWFVGWVSRPQLLQLVRGRSKCTTSHAKQSCTKKNRRLEVLDIEDLADSGVTREAKQKAKSAAVLKIGSHSTADVFYSRHGSSLL